MSLTNCCSTTANIGGAAALRPCPSKFCAAKVLYALPIAWMALYIQIRDSLSPLDIFCAAQVLYALPIAWMALYVQNRDSLSLKPFFALKALEGGIQTLPVLMSTTADVVEPQHRATAFSMLVALMGVTFAFGPAIGAQFSTEHATLLSVMLLTGAIIATALFMPGVCSDVLSGCLMAAARS